MSHSIFTVVIVEDDKDICDYLARSIGLTNKLQIVGSAHCIEDGLNIIERTSPDILLVDLGLPDGSGIELIRAARQLKKPSECMVITIHADKHHLMNALEAGATGYLLKDSLPEDVYKTVLELAHGGSPISPLIARALLKRFNPPKASKSTLIESLTDREIEVLKSLSCGASRKEIADEFSVSVHTIHSHVKHIYEKLEVNSNVSAIRKAQDLKLIKVRDV